MADLGRVNIIFFLPPQCSCTRLGRQIFTFASILINKQISVRIAKKIVPSSWRRILESLQRKARVIRKIKSSPACLIESKCYSLGRWLDYVCAYTRAREGKHDAHVQQGSRCVCIFTFECFRKPLFSWPICCNRERECVFRTVFVQRPTYTPRVCLEKIIGCRNS